MNNASYCCNIGSQNPVHLTPMGLTPLACHGKLRSVEHHPPHPLAARTHHSRDQAVTIERRLMPNASTRPASCWLDTAHVDGEEMSAGQVFLVGIAP